MFLISFVNYFVKTVLQFLYYLLKNELSLLRDQIIMLKFMRKQIYYWLSLGFYRCFLVFKERRSYGLMADFTSSKVLLSHWLYFWELNLTVRLLKKLFDHTRAISSFNIAILSEESMRPDLLEIWSIRWLRRSSFLYKILS